MALIGQPGAKGVAVPKKGGNMERYGKIYKVVTAAIFLMIGCIFTIGRDKHQDIQALSENHRAVKMYRDGVWTGRYEANFENYATGDRSICLSINVHKDMSREDMVSVLDYYEMVWNAECVGESYVGERDNDFTGHAVFFRGDTDEELARIKFFNRKEAEITKEDEPLFPRAYMHSEPEDTGPWF